MGQGKRMRSVETFDLRSPRDSEGRHLAVPGVLGWGSGKRSGAGGSALKVMVKGELN